MSETPIFSICHATARTKPDGWSASKDAWLANADEPLKVEYVLSVHRDDDSATFADEAWAALYPRGKLGKVNIYGDPRNSVHGWNEAAEMATGEILILNADDFFPPPHWDSDLMIKLNDSGKTLEDEFAIHVLSGNPEVEWDKQHMALGIISRALYLRWGYALYPGYESVYSDNDMCEHANVDGCVIQAFDLTFEHRHYTFGKSVEDAVYCHQNRPEAYALGKALLEQRRQDRFSK